MNSYELLEKARDVIAERRHWCQGELEKLSVLGNEPRYCSLGALGVALDGDARSAAALLTADVIAATEEIRRRVAAAPEAVRAVIQARSALAEAAKRRGFNSVMRFNDHSDHADVLEAFAEAIRTEKARHGVVLPEVEEAVASG